MKEIQGNEESEGRKEVREVTEVTEVKEGNERNEERKRVMEVKEGIDEGRKDDSEGMMTAKE